MWETWNRSLGWEDPLERKRLPTPVFFGFRCGSADKESACNVGDLGLILRLGSPPGEWKGYPGEFHGLCSPWGCKELDRTERLLLHINSSQEVVPTRYTLTQHALNVCFRLSIMQPLWKSHWFSVVWQNMLQKKKILFETKALAFGASQPQAMKLLVWIKLNRKSESNRKINPFFFLQAVLPWS